MDNYMSVINQMGLFGVVEPEFKNRRLRVDGKRHTFGKGGKWWYKLFEWHPDAGGAYITGSFGSYKTGEFEKVDVDFAPLSAAEKARRQQEREAREAAAREEREREIAAAQDRAHLVWSRGKADGQSAYLSRKQIERVESVRIDRGWLLVPMIRYDKPREQALQGVQTIKPDGSKLFTAGMSKVGCACRLGLVVAGEPILVGEGYATGASVRAATDWRYPVFVAFDAGNLEHVVHVLRTLYPDSPVLICADDDWQTEGNPGRTSALRITKRFDGVHFVTPVFSRKVARGKKDTDFNDLHALEGLDAVARQLQAPLRYLSRHAGEDDEQGGLRAAQA